MLANDARAIWTSHGTKRGPNERICRVITRLYGVGTAREPRGSYVVEIVRGLPGENGEHRVVPAARIRSADEQARKAA